MTTGTEPRRAAPDGAPGPAAPAGAPRQPGWSRFFEDSPRDFGWWIRKVRSWEGLPQWPPLISELLVIAVVIGVVLWQLHPSLLLSNTVTTGGDNGGHYVTPYYLGWNLLPHGQLTGWDPGWYDGFPLYTYYFLLPDALTAIVGHLIPYNLAFKWSTVLGSVLTPVGAWAMGRLFRLRPPIPAALAALTLPFLFDYTFTIYGGNLFSTLAGEYAYSLSVALAMVFLGLYARGLRTGRGRVWTALALAACILAHIVPAMYALVGAALLTAMELLPRRWRLVDDGFGPRDGVSHAPGREGVRTSAQALWWGGTTVALGGLLTGFWVVPFGLDQAYANSMGYANVTTYFSLLLPGADRWVLYLAAASGLLALLRRSRFGILISILGGLSALGLRFDPFSSLYNVRLLPLWFLSVYLMAGWGLGTAFSLLAQWRRRDRMARWTYGIRLDWDRGIRLRSRPRPLYAKPGAVYGPLAAIALAVVVVVPPFVLSASTLAHVDVHPGANEVNNWAEWNYSGYFGPDKTSGREFMALMTDMGVLGQRYGCGQSMWEYNADLNRFGTPMALMQFPFWTNGCIGSMEGLLFESSATTPYHFLNQAELSVGPSEPQVGLPYSAVDVTTGVEHLQLLGVRYFLASSPQVQQAANRDPALRLIDTSGPWQDTYSGAPPTTTWDIYLIADSPLVAPLANEPAVMEGIEPGQSSWLAPSVAWYDQPARWDVELAQSGPAGWPRVPIGDTDPPRRPVPATTVSDVRDVTTGSSDGETVSFHVSRVGTPVLVKVSYFPNWHATGADGPWRVTPNLMVVVPTSHDVTVTYGSSGPQSLGQACTLVALVALAGLGGAALVARRRRRPAHAPL